MRSLVLLASLLVLACNPEVIEADTAGDEQGSSSGNESNSSTGESGSSTSESASSTSESSGSTTELGDDEPCPAGTPGCPCDAGTCDVGYECVGDVCVEASTTSDTTTDTTTETGSKEMHNCGWLLEKNYYFCGSDGQPDPSMTYPIDCAEFDFPMIDDAPCGAELTYVGCCDAMGDAWYCLDGFVVYEVCGAL